jgi:hypothetical protein
MSRVRRVALRDTRGAEWSLPAGRPTLVCFAKLDCPTCALAMPVVERLGRALVDQANVVVVTQDEDGGAKLRERFELTVPVLDDSQLAVSHEFAIEMVPTLVRMDEAGLEVARLLALARDEWRALAQAMDADGAAAAAVDWDALPELRPGCGSRTLEPGIAERLEAQATGSPLRARRIEIPDAEDEFEFLFEQGLTDGLPVVPPTPERVLRMLAGTKRGAQEGVVRVPPNLAPATVEKIAINAVMAGCRPEYLPVVIAALEAICTDEFNLHGVLATTYFPTPVLIVNGPVRARIGMNAGMNCLGQGNRANAAIGRAVQLVVRNVGGGRPGEVDRATFGQPGKFTFCFPEHEERSPWEPLHVERGFRADQSAVTAYAGGAPTGFIDQLARDARSLATSYGLVLATANHPKHYFQGQIVVLVPPEHVDTFRRDGWTKAQVREQIQLATERPLAELARGAGGCAEGIPQEIVERLGAATRVAKFRSPDDILLVVAGGEAGKFGAYLHPWVGGPIGSVVTTRAIGE